MSKIQTSKGFETIERDLRTELKDYLGLNLNKDDLMLGYDTESKEVSILIKKDAVTKYILSEYDTTKDIKNIAFFEDVGVIGDTEKGFDNQVRVFDEVDEWWECAIIDEINEEIIPDILDILKKYQAKIQEILKEGE